MHKQQGWPPAWEYRQAKPIQTLGRDSQGVDWSWSQCIKSHHAQTSSGKGLPSHFWNRNIIRSILPGLRRKRTGLLLSGPKSSFQIKVHFAFYLEIKVWRLERHRIQAAWSPVWSFRSQWWFGIPRRLLVLAHCVFSSPKSMQLSTRRFSWSTLCLDLLTSFMEMLISFSSWTLAPAHSAKITSSGLLTMILLCLIGQPTCLTWTPYGIYGIFSRERWETVNPTIQTSWRLNSAPHTSLMLSFVLKEPRPSIECINEHTLKNFNCSVLQILFLLILGNILIFWDTGFLKVKVKMEWRSNDEAFGIWHRIFSQRQERQIYFNMLIMV